MDAKKDYYAVLAVLPTADQRVVQAAYRALCKQFHPDIYAGVDGPEKMMAITEAYAVLGDPAEIKRRKREARFISFIQGLLSFVFICVLLIVVVVIASLLSPLFAWGQFWALIGLALISIILAVLMERLDGIHTRIERRIMARYRKGLVQRLRAKKKR
ncbi:MAG: DnaJ domain-containing protein [Candidatus Binatia bacterium]|nr:DnaJ domain-containing protein [Candidatus Binatia bacterium]